MQTTKISFKEWMIRQTISYHEIVPNIKMDQTTDISKNLDKAQKKSFEWKMSIWKHEW